MKTINLKRESILWVLMLIPFIFAAFAWTRLPDQIPTHYGISGQPDDWGGKISILLMPALSIVSYAFLMILPLIDPRRANYTDAPTLFFKRRMLGVVYFTVTGVSLIYGGIIHDWKLHSKIFSSAIFILFAFFGNYTINLKPSFFLGIRNPWTLSSDYVWKQTHLIMGRTMFYGSLVCFIISFFLHGRQLVMLLIVFATLVYVFGWVYSFWLFKKQPVEVQN